MTRAFIVLTMSLLLGGAQVLRAQSARELLGQGVRAYQALEYDAAAALLEESLGRDSAAGLADSLRARALTYLGATELFRGQRDSAVATFRHLVLLNPRYRPDELIFPPQVTNLFQEVRRATRAIAVAVPPVTELRTRIERFTARVLTSSLADVTVTLAREDGTLMRQLYSGPVADSSMYGNPMVRASRDTIPDIGSVSGPGFKAGEGATGRTERLAASKIKCSHI